MIIENIKQDYLKEMGITAWYPRARLTNALEPLLFDALQSKKVDAEAIVDKPHPQAILPNPIEHSVSSKATNNESTVTPPKKSGTDTIRFGLGIYIINDFLVISSLVNDHELYQASALNLIQNIIKAITRSNGDISHHHIISWPFFSNTNADQGKSSAKKYVDSVIEHIKEQHQFKRIIVLGGVMPKLNDWRSPQGEAYGVGRIVLPSVYRMLDDATLKAKAWSLLKNHF